MENRHFAIFAALGFFLSVSGGLSARAMKTSNHFIQQVYCNGWGEESGGGLMPPPSTVT